MTLMILTFIMSLGVIFKITDVLAKGGSVSLIGHIFLMTMPPALAFSIPISALVASLLVFGRLSADGEITAMRACGISLVQILRYPFMLSVVFTLVCLFINNELAPRGHFASRSASAAAGVGTSLDLIEEGRFQEFEGFKLYVGEKRGDQLYNLRITDYRQPDFVREIRAESAQLVTEGDDLIIELKDGRIDPFERNQPGSGFFSRLPIRITDAFRKRTYTKQRKDMTFQDLRDGIAANTVSEKHPDASTAATTRMSLQVEMQKRIALSVSCMVFVMLGVPLGIRSHRRESSIGIAISLLVVIGFYLSLILTESLRVYPSIRPDLIMWVPILASILLSRHLIRRNN